MVSKGLVQAYEMQDFAFKASMALKQSLTLKVGDSEHFVVPDKEQAAMIGTLSKAWKDAQEQIRIHRGKPLPGSLTHEKVRSGRTKRASLSSSMLASLASDAGQDQVEQQQPTPSQAEPTEQG